MIKLDYGTQLRTQASETQQTEMLETQPAFPSTSSHLGIQRTNERTPIEQAVSNFVFKTSQSNPAFVPHAKKSRSAEPKGRNRVGVSQTDGGKVTKVKIKARVPTKLGGNFYIDQYNFQYFVSKIANTLTGKRTHLKCHSWKKLHCSARAWLQENDDQNMYQVHEHQHLSDIPKSEAMITEAKYMAKAVSNPLLKPRAIYGEMISERTLLPNERLALTPQVFFTNSRPNKLKTHCTKKLEL